MQRYKSVVTLGLLLLVVFLFTAPVFAEHTWADGRGNGKNAEDLLDEYPWVGGKGKGKADNMLTAHPWTEHPGNGRGAAAGIDWMTYLRSCLGWLYR